MVAQSSNLALNNSVWVIIFLFLHLALLCPNKGGGGGRVCLHVISEVSPELATGSKNCKGQITGNSSAQIKQMLPVFLQESEGGSY